MPEITKENIYKILEAGGRAPSGSNSQPWKFKVNGSQVEILALPEKDHPTLNFRNRGTWIAHGALIENIIIASSALGYKANITYHPLTPETKIIANITFNEAAIKNEENLYDAIFHRATNRKPYTNNPLTSQQKNELLTQADSISGGKFIIVENREKIQKLAKASSTNEILMLEDKNLHKLFFEEIVWTSQEEKQKMHGLYLKTMELKPPAEKMLRLLKNWKVMNLLAKLGMAKMVAKGNEQGYAACPAIGAIVINDDDNCFLTAGKIMERVWLTATKLGLSCHLMTGVIFLRQRLVENPNFVSKNHGTLIENSYQQMAQIAGINDKNKTLAMLIRIGQGGQPSDYSSKVPIKNLISTKDVF